MTFSGHKPRRGVEILLRDEALDLVNGDGLIDRPARAGILAAAVADAAADGGEGDFSRLMSCSASRYLPCAASLR